MYARVLPTNEQMKKVNLLRTNSDNQDFRVLVRLLDADLARRDGDEHAFYAHSIQSISFGR